MSAIMTPKRRDELKALAERQRRFQLRYGDAEPQRDFRVRLEPDELLGLLERDGRLDFDVAPLLADIAADPAVAEVGHSRSAELRVNVDMRDYSKDARRRLFEKHRVWLLKMPAGLSLGLNLADVSRPEGEPE